MRIAIDLRTLLEPFESGISVYTKEMVFELLKMQELSANLKVNSDLGSDNGLRLDDGLEIELFYQTAKRCPRIHNLFARYGHVHVRHIEISTTWHRLKCLFAFPSLPEAYFEEEPDLIWLPNRREFYRTEIPIVMTIHDFVPERFGRTMSLKGRLLHKIFPLKRLLGLCGGVITPSSSVAGQLKLPRGVKREVTFEGVRLAKRSKEPEMAKRFKKRPFFLAISPADPRKRLSWIKQMALEFPKLSFLIAGMKDGDDRFAKCNVTKQKNLFLLGHVDEEEKLWLLRHAKALLALSEYEGFDLPVLEAVTAKCPVIMSDIAVHNELYKGGEMVKNLSELRVAIHRFAQRKNKGERLGVPIPRGDYTWKGSAKRALFLFRSVVGNKNT